MGRMVEIEVDGLKARAVMFEDAAPKVCEAIWQRLPMQLTFRHTSSCGRQVHSFLDGKNFIKLEREAAQLFVHPGDLVYAFRDVQIGRGPNTGELSEISFYYGRDARRWGGRGDGLVRNLLMGSTVWAAVVEGLEDVGRRLEECRIHGGAVVTIRAVR
jgi:hypothetical protein